MSKSAADRVAALRRMALGLGHDLGNVVMPIRLGTESLARLDLPDRAKADVESIRACAEYLHSLSNGLRMLSQDPNGPGPHRNQTVVNQWWPEMETLLRALLPGRVSLAPFVCGDPIAAELAPHRLTHAVFALVQSVANANGGPAGKVELRLAEVGDPPRLRISVVDVREGGSDDHRQHWPSEFLSPQGQDGNAPAGGFALVHALAQLSGGSACLDVEPGRGATFTLTIPIAGPPRERAPLAIRAAVVNLPDARQSAYIRNHLTGLGIEVHERPVGFPLEGPMLLITADPVGALAAASQGKSPKADRVLYLGDSPLPAAYNLIVLGSRPGPAAIREALKDATRAVEATAV
jgi:hypothetical protein